MYSRSALQKRPLFSSTEISQLLTIFYNPVLDLKKKLGFLPKIISENKQTKYQVITSQEIQLVSRMSYQY